MNKDSEAAKVEPTPAPTGPQGVSVSAAEKSQWVERYIESGLSLREFSTQNGMGYMSLWRWVDKARQRTARASEAAAPVFTELKLPPMAQSQGWAAELALPNGNVLRLSKEVPAALVEQLLRLC